VDREQRGFKTRYSGLFSQLSQHRVFRVLSTIDETAGKRQPALPWLLPSCDEKRLGAGSALAERNRIDSHGWIQVSLIRHIYAS
jgi:hypothetical protein